jgi:putative membrane protein
MAAAVGPVRPALAHDGAPLEPHDLWSAWTWSAAAPLAVAALAYGRGVRTLWRRAGTGRGVRHWQAGAFTLGLMVLGLALVSPLDALGGVLFSAHMVQHMLLVGVAAPLLVLGRPVVPLLWALPLAAVRLLGGRWQHAAAPRKAWAVLTRLALVWALHAAALWTWHLPGLYQAALADGGIHLAEHAVLLGTALLFWWRVVHPGGQAAAAYGTSSVAVFTMALQGGLLGALMTFARVPWYPAYGSTALAWGISPLQDQQLAGMVMWAPAGLIYLAATLALLSAWLRAAERRAWRAERARADDRVTG